MMARGGSIGQIPSWLSSGWKQENSPLDKFPTARSPDDGKRTLHWINSQLLVVLMMAGVGFIGQIPSWPSSGWGQAPWHTFLMVSMSVCPYLGVPSHQLVYKSCTLARPSVLSALSLPLYSLVLYPSQSCTGPGHLSCQLSLYLYTVQSSILLDLFFKTYL